MHVIKNAVAPGVIDFVDQFNGSVLAIHSIYGIGEALTVPRCNPELDATQTHEVYRAYDVFTCAECRMYEEQLFENPRIVKRE